MGAGLPHPVRSKWIERQGNQIYRVGSAEMQGWRATMEDAKSIRLKLSEKHPNLAMFGVFDGHGGELCSKYLETVLPEALGSLDNPTRESEIVDTLLTIDEKFLDDPHSRTHGSTCVFAVVQPRDQPNQREREFKFEVTVCNVGDSRAVLLRKDGRWKCLTRDHKPSLPEERDRIEKAEGKVENQRVDGQLALSRAIGDWSYKLNGRLKPHQQKVIATPEVSRILANEGDSLLICCDGLFEKLSTNEVCKFVHEDMASNACGDPALTLARLLDYSLHKGSKDNMTALCVCFRNGKGYGDIGNGLIAGRYVDYASDDKFKKAYIAFAKSHGVEEEELSNLIPRPKTRTKPGLERQFSGVLSQLKGADRSLLLAMISPTATEAEAKKVENANATKDSAHK